MKTNQGRNERSGRRLAGSSMLLIAIVSALAAGLLASTATAPAAPLKAASGSVSEADFHNAMNKLWEDHITWTRLVIVDFNAGSPELKADETRLLKNQVDIGNAIKPYYGAAAGNKLTSLLKTHILQAVTILQAVKDGNTPKLNTALKAWYVNAHQIAAFLSKANPRNLPLAATTAMMNNHLKLTTAEVVAHFKGKYAADVAARSRTEYDASSAKSRR